MKKPPFKFTNKPFAILSHPKTGGDILSKLLNQFSGLHCYGQLFNKDKIKLPEKKIQRLKVPVESRDEEPLVFLKHLFKLTPKAHSGFVFIFSTQKHILLRRWLINSEAINRVIVLRNPFDIYISQASTAPVGQTAPLIKFDPELFDKKIALISRIQTRLKEIAAKRPESTITINYDELADIAPVQRIADFLGASAHPEALKISANQTSTPAYKALFEDFSQVQAHVSANHPDLVIDPKKI